MWKGDHDLSIFKNFDYALLGDIHKTNQILDDDGRVRYAGSTIQQNHGETNDKGFLIWEIESKEKYKARHIAIKNPKPFITVNLNSDGSVPSGLEFQLNARVRVISTSKLPLDTIRKSLDVIRTKFKPDVLRFEDRSEDKSSVSEFVEQFKKEDLRNVEIQERLIKEYLKDYKINDELLTRVYDINKKYNGIAENNESIARNIDFKILKLEWDNLFLYGPGNSIDFDNMNGIVGIFGKNFSGKSSIIDGLLYTIYNSITKNKKKTVNIINLKANDCVGKVWLKIGNKNYSICRKSEKYIKKLHGAETIEAKTSVNFELFDPVTKEVLNSYNGIDGDETNRNIAKLFGTRDDFLLTSMSSQLGSLSYIDKGSTDRKETLARFLDLEFFAEKYKLANDESSVIKIGLKRFEGRNFEEDIKNIRHNLKDNENQTSIAEKKCKEIESKIIPLEKSIAVLHENIKNIPTNFIDINSIKSKIDIKHGQINKNKDEIDNIEKELLVKEIKLKKVQTFVDNFDRETYVNFKKLLEEIEIKEKEKKQENKKVELLSEVPCGDQYPHCKFIKSAHEAKESISIIDLAIQAKEKEKESFKDSIKTMNSAKIFADLENYNILLKTQNEFNREKENLSKKCSSLCAELLILEQDCQKLLESEQEYNKNSEEIQKLEILLKEKTEKEENIKKLKEEHSFCNKKLIEYHRTQGSLEQKLLLVQQEQQEADTLRQNYEAYDLFMKCMHSNGISYDIIKKSLPTLNNEIAKNLRNIVDFEVYFQNEENRLELYIKKPSDVEALPIEMGSVAQKMLAAMAIRLAFIHISSLPKSDIFILDEPGTSLDAENMEGFVQMLDVIKTHFKCVLLISHLDNLKDTVDIVINIDNKNGFALVNS